MLADHGPEKRTGVQEAAQAATATVTTPTTPGTASTPVPTPASEADIDKNTARSGWSDRLRSPMTGGDITWARALIIGLLTYVVSRIAVAAGAGVRAAQRVVDANQAGVAPPGSGVDLITEVSTSWDGLWYLAIVRDGYPTLVPPNVTYFEPEARAAFFPLYPTLVRIFDPIIPGGDTFSALTLNLLLGAVAVVLVGLLARRLYDNTIALYAMMLTAVFPGSFVMSFAYAETLLIVLAALCLLSLHDERWLLAGIFAALATATRPNGIALVAACIVAAALAIHRRRDWWSLIAVVLSPLGFVAFQLYLGAQAKERLVWFRVQSEAWDEGTSFGLTALRHIADFLRSPLNSPTDAVTTITIITLVAAMIILFSERLPAPMVAFTVVIVALMLVPDTVTARPRFMFTAFPLFIAVAAWLPRRERAIWDLVLVSSGAGLAALTALYGVYGAIP
jgi:Gpi18-like mannosyltransferase